MLPLSGHSCPAEGSGLQPASLASPGVGGPEARPTQVLTGPLGGVEEDSADRTLWVISLCSQDTP